MKLYIGNSLKYSDCDTSSSRLRVLYWINVPSIRSARILSRVMYECSEHESSESPSGCHLLSGASFEHESSDSSVGSGRHSFIGNSLKNRNAMYPPCDSDTECYLGTLPRQYAPRKIFQNLFSHRQCTLLNTDSNMNPQTPLSDPDAYSLEPPSSDSNPSSGTPWLPRRTAFLVFLWIRPLYFGQRLPYFFPRWLLSRYQHPSFRCCRIHLQCCFGRDPCCWGAFLNFL
mmetsp:Transcript_17420/g.20089  ORF Transcript_17420/g.20089 Transcript_17420/m.20089 type:complete len:229 (-) Transcript_17420:425-1111(-)